MTGQSTRPDDFQSHRETYEGFLHGTIALILGVLFVLVALTTFAFTDTTSVLLGMSGLIAGLGSIAVNLRLAKPNWLISIVILVGFALLSAALM
ncbi:MAG: hypothetical protein V6Z86_10170 [Hyphomicrobiales bacterium]